MKLDSFETLLLEQLRDVYSAEKQLTQALPKMAQGASSPKLQEALEHHLGETQQQLERLERIFEELEQPVGRKKCHGMEGLIAEGSEVLKEKGDAAVKDAGIIAAAQKVEHYEIATYGTVRTFAEMLGHSNVAELLQRSLDEEHAANDLLTQLAVMEVNVEAKTA